MRQCAYCRLSVNRRRPRGILGILRRSFGGLGIHELNLQSRCEFAQVRKCCIVFRSINGTLFDTFQKIVGSCPVIILRQQLREFMGHMGQPFDAWFIVVIQYRPTHLVDEPRLTGQEFPI